MRKKIRTAALLAVGSALLALVPIAIGNSTAAQAQPGTLTSSSFRSATLGEDVAYNVYLPAGYAGSARRYPVLYLLHGRGDSMAAWTQMKAKLDQLIGDGSIPATIAIMPDAPWSQRASYYVDSRYKGADPGRPVETAFTQDLIAHVDSTYRTLASRDGRVVGGYSMGGYGALRYSIAHPDLFAASIVLSPAVYFPLPPSDSSAREFGAFGQGNAAFNPARYTELNYPAELKRFEAKNLPSHMFVAVGDDEYQNPNWTDYTHDLDFEAHILYKWTEHTKNLSSELRVVNGGHDWNVWGPEFEEGAKYVFQFVARPQVSIVKATLTGTAAEDREGGVAVDASGNVYQALAAGGSVDGQPNAGGKDVVLVKYGPTGTKLWTREFGTSGTDRAYGLQLDPQGHPVVAGYTNGNLDGNHAGNGDDVFVAKYDPSGTREWLTQLGTTAADRAYGLAVDAAGTVYAGGYTKGNLAGTNAGDKDVILVKLSATGAVQWTRQFGTTGEDKGMSVAAGGSDVYVAGMATDLVGTPLAGTTPGGLDGFLAHFDTAGNRTWTDQVGTTGDDQLWGVAADPTGVATVTGYTSGSLFGTNAGGDDLVTARIDRTGTPLVRDQLGTLGNERGTSGALDGASTYVSGFSDGNVETAIGGFDGVLVRYDASLGRTWARQYGTTETDGGDAFSEGNVFVAARSGSIWTSGYTEGSTATQQQAGSGDVYLAHFDATGVNG
jgi:enterochelin esterase-like enzyme